MNPLLGSDEEEESSSSRITRQAFSYVGHTLLALIAWMGLMAIGYILNPRGVPQMAILAVSFFVPLLVGLVINRILQNDLAPAVWIMGMIWILIVALWILDMPTGPNACLECGATEKIVRTFFSIPQPSGLIDNDGPFLGTWPAAALFGYGIGAKFGLSKKKIED
jgi:hypothetical protein